MTFIQDPLSIATGCFKVLHNEYSIGTGFDISVVVFQYFSISSINAQAFSA